jgi:hypothetical protein
MLDPPPPPHARPKAKRAVELMAFYLGLMTPRLGPAGYVSRRIGRRLRRRAGRHDSSNLDTPTVETAAAVRVALSNGVALRRHRPRIHDGPVHVIASHRRIGGPMWQPSGWPALLRGPLSVIGVADEHMDTLNPANPRFGRALRESIERVVAGNSSQEAGRSE